MKNFGEFFNNQIEHAGTIILSRTQNVSEAKLKTDIELIRSLNKDAHIITTPWDDIDGKQILDAMENVTNLELEMLAEAAAKVAEEHEHHHHHDGECGCGHDHHDEEHEHHHITMMNVAADMTTTMQSMNIIITMASVAVDIITSMVITTPMKYLQAGA